MNRPPRTIYLQWHGDSDPDDPAPVCEAEVTWCSTKCFGSDVEYVRADVLTAVDEALAEIEDQHHGPAMDAIGRVRGMIAHHPSPPTP
jgi:hypothetical protein